MANSANFEASLKIKAGVEGTKEIDKLSQSLSEAGVDVDKLTKQTEKLGNTSNQVHSFANAIANIRVGRQGVDDIKALIQGIEQAGGSVNTLKERYQQLEGAWNALNPNEQSQRVRRLRESLAGLGTTVQEAARNSHKLDQELSETSKTLNTVSSRAKNADNEIEKLFGVRTNNAINTEITQVNTALATLRQRLNAGTISQQEFNRINAAAEQRLNALQAELNQTSADIQGVNKASNQAGGGFTKLKTALMGMAGAYVGVQTVTTGIKELVNTSAQLDSLNQKLEYATGSAKATGETWEYLKDLANELGLEQVGLANGYAQLASATKNLNMSQADTRTAFEGVANAAAAMSLTTDETNGVMLALSQIAGKGKVSMEELRGQLGERLTPAMGIAAQAMGVTTAELEKMVEQGIDAKEFLPKFGAALTESFGQQAQNNINTTTGAINLISNKLTDLKTKVLDSFAGDAIASGTQFFADTLDKISNAMDEIDPASIEAVKAVFAQLFSVIGTISQTLGGLYTDFNNLFAAMTGFDDTSEKVGFLTRTLQGLSVIVGAIDDVFQGLQATANLAIGGIMSAFAKLYGAFAKFELLPDSMQAKYQNMSDGLQKASDDAFARFDKNVNEFESSTKKALDATLTTAKQMAEKAEKASQKAIEAFDALAKDATASGEELLKNFGEAVDKATSPEQVEQLIEKFGELQAQGKITGEQLAQGVNLATPKLIELQNALKDTGNTAEQMADEATDAAENIKVKMADTANSLGLDFDKASNQVSASFGKISTSVMDVADNFDALKEQGYNASTLLIQGLDKLGEQVSNKVDLNALIVLWQQFGEDGKLSAEQVQAGIDGINQNLEKTPHLLDETTKALKALGIISKEEAKRQAQEQIQNFELAKQAFEKGLISAEQLQQAIGKVQKSVQVSGDASQQAWLKSQQYVAGLTLEIDKATDSVNKNTQATAQNSAAKADNAKATEEIAKAEEKAEQAQTSRLTSYTRYAPSFIASAEQQISKLQELGATQEQVTALTEQMHHKMSMMPSASIYQMAQSSARLSKELAQQTAQFNRTKTAAEYWAKALNGAEVSSNDLAKAQLALRNATNASIGGIIKMDGQTLSGLQNAIDSTRRKLRDLADDAKNVADNLEATYAKMQGNDDKARDIEQAKKLNDLQDKLNAAKKRGNSDEIRELNRAVELQRKINAEENKQAKAKQQQAYDKQLDEQNKLISKQEAYIAKMTGDDELALKIAQQQKLWDMQDEMAKAQASNNADAIANAKYLLELRQQANDAELKQLQDKLKQQADKDAQKQQQNRKQPNQTQTVAPPTQLNIGISAKDVADVWDKRMTELVEKGLKDFMNQLKTEANRLAR